MLFALRPDAWGRGLATEAARAVLAHARDVLRLPRVTAAANPENRASWRILEKIGMRPVGLTRTEREELLLYAAWARAAVPGFAGFSAERGKQFCNARNGGEWSCASCHTAARRQPGTRAVTR